MAISLIGVGANKLGEAVTSIEVAKHASTADDDLMVLVGVCSDNVSLDVNEAGWTEQEEALWSVASDGALVVATKIASSESGDYTLRVTGATSETLRAFILTYRGVDTGTPMDATATKLVDMTNSDIHDPPAIITVTANAFVLTVVGATQSDGAAIKPTGYTLRREYGTGSGLGEYVGVADIDAGAAGSEDPGTWSGLSATADSGSITIALRPAASGPSAHQMQAYQGMERMNGGFRR